MCFVAHRAALVRLADPDVLGGRKHKLLAPSSTRSHILSRLHEAVRRGDSDEEVAGNA